MAVRRTTKRPVDRPWPSTTSRRPWGETDRGIQLFGTARELRGRDATSAGRDHAARFKATSVTLAVGAGGRLR